MLSRRIENVIVFESMGYHRLGHVCGKPNGMISRHLLYRGSQVLQCLRRLHWHSELRSDPHVRAGPLATRQDLALSHVLCAHSEDGVSTGSIRECNQHGPLIVCSKRR